jgi:hypothetical protein
VETEQKRFVSGEKRTKAFCLWGKKNESVLFLGKKERKRFVCEEKRT